jgi:hypothetical protein
MLALAAAAIIAPFTLTGDVTISGTGCGNPGTAAVPLPAGATQATVRRPSVGDTGLRSRITEATIDGAAARFTAVGAGDTCDPTASDTPPDQRTWADDYSYTVGYRAPTTVAYWAGAGVGRPRVRPSKIGIILCCSVRHIRWRTFGGRTAVGFGAMTFPSVPKGARCLECGKRFKVVLSRPSQCSGIGQRVYYGKVAFITTRRIGVLKPGTEEFSQKPACYGGAKPVT